MIMFILLDILLCIQIGKKAFLLTKRTKKLKIHSHLNS